MNVLALLTGLGRETSDVNTKYEIIFVGAFYHFVEVSFYSSIVESLYQVRPLNFARFFLWMSWENHVSFLISWHDELHWLILNAKPYLLSWDKVLLLIIHFTFYVLLNSFCKYFARYLHLYSWVMLVWNFLNVFFWLCYQSNASLLKWVWKYSLLLYFMEEFW